jgi:ABC-type bacteriocin/lantibiotic exporter with double-glycine peptidase domain
VLERRRGRDVAEGSRAGTVTAASRIARPMRVLVVLSSTVMLLGTLVLMGVPDLVLLVMRVVAVLVVAPLFALVLPAIAKPKEEAQEHLGRLGGTLEGVLCAIKTVKANRAEERIGEQVVASAATSADHSIRAARKEALAWTIGGDRRSG